MKYLLIILIFLTACTSDYKKYTINKGNHFSNQALTPNPLQDDELHQEIKFGTECWYAKENVTHSGWNKLTGLSQILGVHNKSGRIVWQPDFDNEGRIRLAGYVYGADTNRGYFIYDKGWTAQDIMTVDVNKPFDARVHRWDDKWEFKVRQNGETRAVWIYAYTPKPPPPPLDIYYLELQTPYFGGRDKAYWRMNIYIKQL